MEHIDLNLEASFEDQKKEDKKEEKKAAPKSPKKKGGKKAANKKENDDYSVESGEERSKSKSNTNTKKGKKEKVLDITEEKSANELQEGYALLYIFLLIFLSTDNFAQVLSHHIRPIS